MEVDTLKEKGVFKSSSKVIEAVVEQLHSNLLGDDEVLNQLPTSFTNIFLQTVGKLSSLSFYEQMMYKNELQPSTAIKLRSLMNKLSSDSLSDIFAQPARITFGLGYKYNDLINKSIKVVENGLVTNHKTLVLNKDFIIRLVNLPNFTLDHDVLITVNEIKDKNGEINYNIFAKFDYDEVNTSLKNINNPFISSQIVNYEGEKIFIMLLPMYQYNRDTNFFEINSPNQEIEIDFKDNLYTFEVFYKEEKKEKYVLLKGKPDGLVSVYGYNYSIDIDEMINLKKIRINFNDHRNKMTLKQGDSIKVVVYTTLGEKGNFSLPNIYENYKGLSHEYRQNLTDIRQNALTDIIPFLTLKDSEAIGGRNMKSFEEIRSLVIQRGSNSTVITPGQLEKIAENNGFILSKIRYDVKSSLEFKLSSTLKDKINRIISSSTKNIEFVFDETGSVLNLNNVYFINPTDVFTFNNEEFSYFYSDEETKSSISYDIYKRKYGKKNVLPQFFFPYTIKIDTERSFKTDIYNLSLIDKSIDTQFLWFNNNSPYDFSIFSIILNRNILKSDFEKEIENLRSLNVNDEYCYPMNAIEVLKHDKNIITSQEVKGFYKIDFMVSTNAHVISLIDSFYKNNIEFGYDANGIALTPNKLTLAKINEEAPLKFRLKISNPSYKDEKYTLDAYPIKLDSKDNIVYVRAYLPTNGVINYQNKVEIINETLTPTDLSVHKLEKYSLQDKIEAEIYILLRDKEQAQNIIDSTLPENMHYNTILNNTDKKGFIFNYYISSVYSCGEFNLYEYLSDKIKINADFKILKSKLKIDQSIVWDEIKYGQRVFDTYTEDEYDRFTDTVIKVYDRDIVAGNNPDGTVIYEHLKGDAILNDDGNVTYEVENGVKHIVGNIRIGIDGKKVVRYKKGDNKHKIIEKKPVKIPIKHKKFTDGTYHATDFIEYTPIEYIEEPSIKYCDAACYIYERFTEKTTINLPTGEVTFNPGDIKVDNSGVKVVKRVEYIFDGVTDEEKLLLSEKGIPLRDSRPKVKCILKKTPVINRIYQNEIAYREVLDAFQREFDKMDSISSNLPYGVQTSLGVRNTTGRGNYEIYDQSVNRWVDIDDISLSFSLGVKFSDILSEDEMNTPIKNVKDSIVDYIYNLSVDIFTIFDLIDHIKRNNPLAQHVILYKINDYSANEVQAIRKKVVKDKDVDDVLSIKQTYSSENEEGIIFEPDIFIKVI